MELNIIPIFFSFFFLMFIIPLVTKRVQHIDLQKRTKARSYYKVQFLKVTGEGSVCRGQWVFKEITAQCTSNNKLNKQYIS